jgi:hypothetical protein
VSLCRFPRRRPPAMAGSSPRPRGAADLRPLGRPSLPARRGWCQPLKASSQSSSFRLRPPNPRFQRAKPESCLDAMSSANARRNEIGSSPRQSLPGEWDTEPAGRPGVEHPSVARSACAVVTGVVDTSCGRAGIGHEQSQPKPESLLDSRGFANALTVRNRVASEIIQRAAARQDPPAPERNRIQWRLAG